VGEVAEHELGVAEEGSWLGGGERLGEELHEALGVLTEGLS
jgi:hypothetical protein